MKFTVDFTQNQPAAAKWEPVKIDRTSEMFALLVRGVVALERLAKKQ